MLPTARPRSPWESPARRGAGGGGGEWRGARGWAAWRRRVLQALRARAHERAMRAPQIHLIRLDAQLSGAWGTPRRERARGGRGPPAGRRAPLELPAFQLPPRFHAPPTLPTIHYSLEAGAGAGDARVGSASVGSAGVGSASVGSVGVAGAGAAVLALAALVLMARAVERCLDKRFFKLLRRRSDEWFTPNVLATSGQTNEEQAEPSACAGCEFPSEAPSGDPPPPYSECAAEPFAPKRRDSLAPGAPSARPSEEPPPPYSACYVAFSNPKDGPPSVHFFNGQRQLFANDPSGAPETDEALHFVGCDGTELLDRNVDGCLESSSQVSAVASATSSRVPVA